jgi:tRNA uridine 5-carboxymethylaminomethyl modification enzyme
LKELSPNVLRRVAVELKYEGYIAREMRTIKAADQLEHIKIPTTFPYDDLPGLSREVIEKLKKFKPENLGQAGRISGITPAALQIVRIYLTR